MAYAFVQQVASAGSPTTSTSITNPSATVTAGNFLILAAICDTTNASLLTITGTSDTWSYAGCCNSGAGQSLAIYCAQNVAGGATAPVVTSPGTDLYSTDLWEYSGLATSSAILATGAASGINAGGVAGANTLTSGSLSVSNVPAMLFSVCENFNNSGHAPATAGTSPIAFTGRAAVWAGNNTGQTLATLVSEDTRVTSTGSYAPTFGTTSSNNNSYDTMGIFSMMVAEAGTAPAVATYPLESAEYF